jgi:hypothetical protein
VWLRPSPTSRPYSVSMTTPILRKQQCPFCKTETTVSWNHFGQKAANRESSSSYWMGTCQDGEHLTLDDRHKPADVV